MVQPVLESEMNTANAYNSSNTFKTRSSSILDSVKDKYGDFKDSKYSKPTLILIAIVILIITIAVILTIVRKKSVDETSEWWWTTREQQAKMTGCANPVRKSGGGIFQKMRTAKADAEAVARKSKYDIDEHPEILDFEGRNYSHNPPTGISDPFMD